MKKIYVLLIMFACVFSAHSQTPSGLEDLIEMRASYLDQEMKDRGYKFVKTTTDGNLKNSIYHNRSANQCVKCVTANGKVVSISNSYGDCPNNSYGSNSYNNYGYNNYHNHDNQNSYHTGSYSNYNYGNNNYGVNRSNGNYEYYDDLVYKDARNAYSKLQQRGFYEVKKVQDGGNTYKLFYNDRTRQCIKTTSRDERITSINTSNHCNR
jgi:hypothetical protein